MIRIANEQPFDEEICNRAKHGWIRPYLAILDAMFQNRWNYWLRTILAGQVLDEPIPKIKWLSSPEGETQKNIEQCINLCDYHRGRRTLELFVDWLLHAFGDPTVTDLPPEIQPKTNAAWYRTYNLGLYLKHPFDYLGQIATEYYGGGRNNRAGYFPTPMHICSMMAEMQMTEKDKTVSVYDPCIGSGRFLMVASNYSLNLYGMDIDPVIIKICRANMWQYVPWAIARPQHIKGLEPKENIEQPIQQTTEETQERLLKYVQGDLF